MREYKDSDDFENDATETGRDVYFVGFANCKAKVAQVYPTLDLSTILALGEEEGEEATEERVAERADANEAVIEVPGTEITTIEAPKEMVVASKVET